MTDITELLSDEADLCRKHGPDDIANLIDAAKTKIETLRAALQQSRSAVERLAWSDYYGIKGDMMSNGCEHGFKPAASCPNAVCEKGELERMINAALQEQSNEQ